jgi:hypothetical protein
MLKLIDRQSGEQFGLIPIIKTIKHSYYLFDNKIYSIKELVINKFISHRFIYYEKEII